MINLDSLELNNNRKGYFKYGYCSLVHPGRLGKEPEDSFYCDESMMVVNEGISHWRRYNINPREYSQELNDNIV